MTDKEKRRFLPKQEQLRLKNYEEFSHEFDTLGDYRKAMIKSYRDMKQAEEQREREDS
ncbi:hypothetical protein [Sporosarcina sp. Te-1]|uniref:hypothetical protein n=1 Tax=Sporosarcina sp. Te-1 TaxID=2818390 RepID=UPI001A9F84E1|nr:hypothetical protein [Sporosarcina sp. Te-1]QTD41936.1 hypothetical protein J3U78_03535 [Sporosarcina sp. Te-1]